MLVKISFADRKYPKRDIFVAIIKDKDVTCMPTIPANKAELNLAICDCLSENPPSSHLLVFLEIPF